jgi:hypothetical protein
MGELSWMAVGGRSPLALGWLPALAVARLIARSRVFAKSSRPSCLARGSDFAALLCICDRWHAHASVEDLRFCLSDAMRLAGVNKGAIADFASYIVALLRQDGKRPAIPETGQNNGRPRACRSPTPPR